MVSGTCRSYVDKRYKCAEKGCEQKEGTIANFLEQFLIRIQSQIDSKKHKKNDQQKTSNIMPKGIPK